MHGMSYSQFGYERRLYGSCTIMVFSREGPNVFSILVEKGSLNKYMITRIDLLDILRIHLLRKVIICRKHYLFIKVKFYHSDS